MFFPKISLIASLCFLSMHLNGIEEDKNVHEIKGTFFFKIPLEDGNKKRGFENIRIFIQETQEATKNHLLFISPFNRAISYLEFRIYYKKMPITPYLLGKMITMSIPVCFYLDTTVAIKIPEDIDKRNLYISDITAGFK